jgi:hypothetical protein
MSSVETEASANDVSIQITACSSPSADLNKADALCSPMKIYEAGQLDEEETEVDLMIQLSGMVHRDT